MTTLSDLNTCPPAAFVEALRGIYEHSPWIAERASGLRPFASAAALKQALQATVTQASEDEQLALLRAHPELAGKAAIAGELTAESTGEQAASGLNRCSPEEYAVLHALNAQYKEKFGFPFILAVKGPTGRGLTRAAIIETFARRLKNTRGDEMRECLRQVHRIAEIRLNELLKVQLLFGPQVMDWAETLGAISDSPDGLTCAYMTPSHQRSASQLRDWMTAAGMDAHIDAVGNVVGRYAAAQPDAKTLITGSHYDTVRNGGKYDGRLGILLPIALVRHLHRRGERLPFHLEVIGFAEEEGVRYQCTFLGSSAVTGRFAPSLLEQQDSEGTSMRAALAAAGHDPAAIPAIARDPASLLGFVEVHIEQGPVLLERGLPVGVVTAIAGSSRYLVELTGVASHAGTTPMGMRRDAAAAAAPWLAPGQQALLQRQNIPDGLLALVAAELAVPLRAGRLDPYLYACFEQRLHALSSVQAACERIAGTPLPFAYTLLLHRCAWLFCVLLPFGLAGALGWATPVVSMLLAYAFFGLDQLGEELEEPFGLEPNDLPLDAMVRTLEIDVLDALGEHPLPEPLQPQGYLLQ